MVVVSLGLGIGANTAIFSLIDTLMLRLLPVRDPRQLVELLQKYPGEPRGNGFWSPQSYEHFRNYNHIFSGLIGFSASRFLRACLESRTGSSRWRIRRGELLSGARAEARGRSADWP